MKKSDHPIILSGRVFTSKLLALELRGTALPSELRHGDVKLLAVPKGHGYAGFVTAYVYDCALRRWRKLALRAGAAVEAIYRGPVERLARARACIEHVRSLRGQTASWDDGTYKVKAPTPQDDTSRTSATASGAEADWRSSAAAAPRSPTGEAHQSGSGSNGKAAVEPTGQKGQQLRLF